MGVQQSLAVMYVALAAAAFGTSPARGQCRLCDKPTTALAQSGNGDTISLEIETSLNFDRLILAGQGSGAAIVRPDGSNVATGALAGVSPRAMVGTVAVHGAPGRAVRVELPPRIDLYSLSGSRIALDDVATDLPPLPHLDSAGNLSFRFGGRVTISGDSDGSYRGDMPITVEYQ